MTAQEATLTLGIVTLTGCGGGLVLMHDSNPALRGLQWMGSALLMGGVVAALTLGAPYVPMLDPLAKLGFLLAFMCCYRADKLLLGDESDAAPFGIGLLCIQVLSMLLEWTHVIGFRSATLIVSLLVAAQVTATVALIRRHQSGQTRLATRFTVILMYLVIASHLTRGALATAGLLQHSRWSGPLNLIIYQGFVAVAIGLSFAFFWRTTTKLSGELQHMASTDPLTRVFNRRVFLNWCESEQSRSLRLHAPFSVLMIDFDHFKAVNDTFGHHVGDMVLCSAVEQIQDSIRGIDVLCRWGGEEFAVLLPNASEEATVIVAERVRRNIQAIGSADAKLNEISFAELSLSASIGTATFEGEGDTHGRMLERADAALYEAKRTGRNKVMRAKRSRYVSSAGTGALAVAETL